MGAFFTNYQVRTDSPGAVARALETLAAGAAFVSPASGGWVTVYDEASEGQDLDVLRRVATRLSRDLATAVVAFLVHDSDVLMYFLYEDGQVRDEYNSCPDYFEESDESAEDAGGDAAALLPHCRAGTTLEQVEAVLRPESVFAEQALDELAGLLGIDPVRAAWGFNYFTEGRDDGSIPGTGEYLAVGPAGKG